MLLRNRSTNQVVASDVVIAADAVARSIGLLMRKDIAPCEGMWFPNSWMIHTLGMRATIDVLFLDRQNRVIRVRPAIPPNRFAAAYGATTVVELGAGALDDVDILVGDCLELEG